MEDRLTQLRDEYERGVEQLTALDQRRQQVYETLLRISGAIQVLEELLMPAPAPAAPQSAD
jgi:hypothetical protein